MSEAVQHKLAHGYGWGRLTGFGLAVAVATGVLDQALKFYLLDPFGLAERGRVALAPFVDLVLVWNTGISYGLFPQEGLLGETALFAFKIAAVAFLWVWLSRATSRLTALALGLIIGGALGNAFDRFHWPGVMDFVLLHAEAAGRSFKWYVFNLADVAIVAGVAGLLYESVRSGASRRAVKAP